MVMAMGKLVQHRNQAARRHVETETRAEMLDASCPQVLERSLMNIIAERGENLADEIAHQRLLSLVLGIPGQGAGDSGAGQSHGVPLFAAAGDKLLGCAEQPGAVLRRVHQCLERVRILLAGGGKGLAGGKAGLGVHISCAGQHNLADLAAVDKACV